MKSAAGILGVIALVTTGCGDDKKSGYSFGAPAIAPIVDSTTPDGLKGGSALLDTDAFLRLIDTSSTEESFKTYITNYVFKKDTTGKVAGPVFYRYWVDVLDTGMSSVETRLKEMEDKPESCWNQTAVELTHTFTIGGQEVSAVGKYNCWENQSTPNSGSGGGQRMAFGKDDTHFYLMYASYDSAELEQQAQGERILIARAAADSSTADIWFIGRSRQIGPGGNIISGVANRIMADKTSGAFAYGLTDEAIGSTNCAMYARSNGTVVNFQARTPKMGSSSECIDVENMAWGTGACYDAKTLATATGCESLAAVPTGYGTSAPFKETDVTEIETDSATITDIDFAAAGIAELKAE